MKTPYIPLHKHFDMRRCTAAPFRFAFFFFWKKARFHMKQTLSSPFPSPCPGERTLVHYRLLLR